VGLGAVVKRKIPSSLRKSNPDRLARTQGYTTELSRLPLIIIFHLFQRSATRGVEVASLNYLRINKFVVKRHPSIGGGG
jgi:hypothetical protein